LRRPNHKCQSRSKSGAGSEILGEPLAFAMTLVISARFRSGVAIQADGQSNYRGSVKSLTLQKIFPIAGSCLAISHSGINCWEGEELAERLQRMSFSKCRTHADVAGVVDIGLREPISKSWCKCQNCAAKKEGINFLFEGFDAMKRWTRLKLIWDWASSHSRREIIENWGHAHGEAKTVQWGSPPKNSDTLKVKEIASFVDKLFLDSLTRTGTEVGGHIHGLTITTRGSEWLIPPNEPIVTLE
jgi:hypothetical protein